MLRGSTWSVARIVGPQLFVLIVSVAAARFLGPDQMGRQSFIAFIALSTAAIFNGGISQMLTRFVGEGIGAERWAATRGLIARSYRIGICGAVLGAMIPIGAALAGQEPSAAWWLAGVGCGLAIVQAIPNAILNGALRWREISVIGLVTGAAAVPVTVAVLAAGGGITGFFAVEVAMIGANMLWSQVACRRALRDLGRETAHDRGFEHRAWSFAALSTLSIVLSTVVFKRSEFFFLEHYADNAAIAVYSIAFASVYGITALTEALGNTVMPAFATLFGSGDENRIRLGFERGQRLLILFALPLTAGAVAFGPELLSLVYGRQYSETGELLQIMVLGVPLLALMGLANAYLNGLGKIRPVLAITALAAVVNLSLAFILIPGLEARGAALANLGSQLVAGAITIAYADHLLGRRGIHSRTLLATFAASAVAGGLGFLVADELGGLAGVLLGAMAAAASFTAVAALIKPIRPDDADWLCGTTAGTPLARPAQLACRAFSSAAPTG
ncbi:MAG TPA: polysaccharide biosynthesis C-terminal domain-containing protein [Solirubrobacterales bacterium]|nr:polysaccharide biosynthesis C-terminal domain-containing protein [Solirubrobacterales bacterium]